jgi:lysophospholipase L1-like esterase
VKVRSLTQLVVAVGAVLALTGCGGSDPAQPAPMESGPVGLGPVTQLTGSYVALGDSYSAAPGVPTVEIASGCLRSTNNYPHLIADAEPGLKLVDVTCSAATTASLALPQEVSTSLGISVPPQLHALTPSTSYVTVSIGGNDLGLFSGLVGCMTNGGCKAAYGDKADATIEQVGQHVTRALRAIHDKAPSAEVALVGYPQLVPASGSCPQLRLDASDMAFVHGVLVKVSQRLAQAARDADALFVDVLSASEGHDICSDDPWINGPRATSKAAAFHPFLAEQRAVAELVVDALA